jgi:hypothetical protein
MYASNRRHQPPLRILSFPPASTKLHREVHDSACTVMRRRRRRTDPTLCAHELMTFLFIAIPLMILTVSIAAVPLLVLTTREHRMRQVEVREHATHVRP